MKPTVALAAAVLALGSLSACGNSDNSSSSTTLTVFAASSLTDTFTQIGKDFESSHSGVTVTFSFGGSSDLVAQLQQGAPADVFASADTANMDKATSASLVSGKPVTFASNTLEIAVPPDNPAGITSFADLAKPGVKLVDCAPDVPCGAAAAEVAKAAKVTLSPVSQEDAVTDVLTKVESGEADAGLVYVTDVMGAGDKVKGIKFPESKDAVNVYPIAALSGSSDLSLAKEFVSAVTDAAGQKVLSDAGFAKP